MDTFEELAVEKDFHDLSLTELQAQRSGLESRINRLQNQISDLAFNNYRTYADAGRTAENCKNMFTDMSHFMTQVKRDIPTLLKKLEDFHENSADLQREYAKVDEITSKSSPIWEILNLPKTMEKCIRSGQYEAAYALTNFAVNLKQSKLVQNPIIKHIADILIEARHGLLDELFNKFAGPIDLAKSIQVVNNIRKIPYISNTQLRVSILQYRDIYLEKNVNAIMSEPDFLLRVIEVYRDCMYDTMVLYLAVFPESDPQRRYTMSDDPRWERWTGSSQNYLLQSWANRNVERLLELIRTTETKSALDIEAMIGKLMSFAMSFGRMGLDFRSLVVEEFTHIIMNAFTKKLEKAVKKLTANKKLVLMDGEIFESTRRDLEGKSHQVELDFLSAPIELCAWDDLCEFGNDIIDAMNETRHYLSPIYLNSVFAALQSSIAKVLVWIDSFLPTEESSTARRAAKILLSHFTPYINECFFSHFPFEQSARLFFRGHFSRETYESHYCLLSRSLFAHCEHSSVFDEILSEVEQSKAEKAANNERTGDENNAESDHISEGHMPRKDENGETQSTTSSAAQPSSSAELITSASIGNEEDGIASEGEGNQTDTHNLESHA